MLKELFHAIWEKAIKPAEFIQKIQRRDWHVTPTTVREIEPLRLSCLCHNNLLAFCDYINKLEDDTGYKELGAFVNIDYHGDVVLTTCPNDREERDEIVQAFLPTGHRIDCQGIIGDYKDQEEFIINLLTWFENTPDRDRLFKLVGNLSKDTVQNNADDGVSQRVNVTKGVTFKDTKTIKDPIFKLIPYSTFKEVDQPVRTFLLRVKGGNENSAPRIALFTADNGRWEIEAQEKVSAYIKAKCPDITVIG